MLFVNNRLTQFLILTYNLLFIFPKHFSTKFISSSNLSICLYVCRFSHCYLFYIPDFKLHNDTLITIHTIRINEINNNMFGDENKI